MAKFFLLFFSLSCSSVPCMSLSFFRQEIPASLFIPPMAHCTAQLQAGGTRCLYLAGIMEYTKCASASAGRSPLTKESHETGLRDPWRRTGGRPSGHALLHLDGIGQRSGLLRHCRLLPVPGPRHRRSLHVVDRYGRLRRPGLPGAAGGCPGRASAGGTDPAGRYFFCCCSWR